MAQSPTKRIFIFDNPRSRSHLFFRYLSTHPELSTHYHPYVNAGALGPEKIHYKTNFDPERIRLIEQFWEPFCSDDNNHADSERELIKQFNEIEKSGKVPVGNEHCCYTVKQQICIDAINSRKYPTEIPSNPTLLPNDFWARITHPIVLIRHPALQQPSLYRSLAPIPALKDFDPNEPNAYWFTTLTWSRLLFDSLRAQGRDPIVVDGEDVVTRTNELGEAVTKRLGLSAGGVSDTWEPMGRIHENPVFNEMTRTTWESTGVQKKDKPTDVSIDKALASIQAEFGKDVADKTRPVIEKEMEHWNYLIQFKV